jgi:hypothetical protein
MDTNTTLPEHFGKPTTIMLPLGKGLYVDLDEVPLSELPDDILTGGMVHGFCRDTPEEPNTNILGFANKDTCLQLLQFADSRLDHVRSLPAYETRPGRSLLHSVGPKMFCKFLRDNKITKSSLPRGCYRSSFTAYRVTWHAWTLLVSLGETPPNVNKWKCRSCNTYSCR